jgi:hypothetical protein
LDYLGCYAAEEEFCGAADSEAVAQKGVKAGGRPDLVAAAHEEFLGHWGPSFVGFESKKGCVAGDGCVRLEVVFEGVDS